MAKKKRPARMDAQNELKSLESKWLKDQRLHGLEPIQVRVSAAKVAAVVELAEHHQMGLAYDLWPLAGAEELVKMDEAAFRQGLSHLLQAGVINAEHKIRKTVGGVNAKRRGQALDLSSAVGLIAYRCIKPGGVTLADRDEYVAEDQEATYTEENIAESPNLQNAIASEWLVRVGPKTPR